jgi:hypothetical protein
MRLRIQVPLRLVGITDAAALVTTNPFGVIRHFRQLCRQVCVAKAGDVTGRKSNDADFPLMVTLRVVKS